MKLNFAKIRNFYHLCCLDENERQTNFRAIIPYYQRPYTWSWENVEILISDFFEDYSNNANINEEYSYFIGALVSVFIDGNHENSDFIEIIDGQQRLTTLYLMEYTKFLLMRNFVLQLISSQRIADINSGINNLLSIMNNIFTNTKEVEDLRNFIVTDLRRYSEEDKEGNNTKKDDIINKIKNQFIEKLGLSSINYNSEDYFNDYNSNMKRFLISSNCSLRYKREKFNQNLIEYLSLIDIQSTNQSAPELKVNNVIPQNYFYNPKNKDLENNYLLTIQCIFTKFLERVGDINKLDSFLIMEKIIEKID